MKKLSALILTAILAISTQSQAASVNASSPKEFVQKVSDKVVEIIKSTESDEAKEKKLIALFDSNVDLDFMGRFVLGQNFRKANDAQKKQFLKSYREYVVYSYIPRFRMYSGESLKIIKVLPEGDQTIVKTSLATEKSKTGTVLVDYRIVKKGSQYKLVDIIGEGISLITTQRSDFSAALANGDLDGFLAKLQSKADNLKARSRDPEYIKQQYKQAK